MELLEEIQPGCEADLFQPLLACLHVKKTGKIAPPYIPEWAPMPLHQLCQLALLWEKVGYQQEACNLAHWLLSLEPFLPLWCPEKIYNESMAKHWFSLLSSLELAPGWQPDCDLMKFHTSSMSAAFTWTGNGTSLGVIKAKEVEIRAFGPQTASLSFGIQGKGSRGWARCCALPEVWIEMKPEWKESECRLDFRFAGLKPEMPLSLAFYIKAKNCRVEKDILEPKSLRRFKGEAKGVQADGLTIESSHIHKVQVIPLAGENGFWDCTFLASFEMHPLASQVQFYIR